MRRLLLLTFLTLAAAAVAAPATWAGSPHFVGDPTVTRAGDSLTVAGKEAGLGSETQVNIQVSAQAACLNRGQNFPSAANKETFTAQGTFPVQNGKALFSLTLTPHGCGPRTSRRRWLTWRARGERVGAANVGAARWPSRSCRAC